ncbi:lycopene cyclase domain-containing protein [bacterium]|nr:lycopene cyclase domain-containing protein [bacterium]NBX98423.1 lycopene cyclase domain-containing protein [bacterium]NDC94359.1 lycopene cyclase domain-containing protein [bacterium]NDD83831.1 lycopene cyclase domain-containing protein [bacterium]NDG29680.1 lycopene cyclase domain-containing protein [bacterium]
MQTYLVFNIIVVLLVVLLFSIRVKKPSKAWLYTFISLLVLTTIFDSLIVALKICDYDTSKILGIYVGKAPIEDFFYAVIAAILVPSLWNKFASKDKRS